VPAFAGFARVKVVERIGIMDFFTATISPDRDSRSTHPTNSRALIEHAMARCRRCARAD